MARSQFQTRTHPLLSRHNAWTWKFVPGVVLGFLLKCWVDKQNPLQVVRRLVKQAGGGSSASTEAASNGHLVTADPEDEIKMVLCVNDELKMGKGKVAAQCAHASMGVVQRLMRKAPGLLAQYEQWGQAKIALRVPTTAELLDLAAAAAGLGLPVYVVQDAGRTQIPAGSRTVAAIGPGPKSVIDKVTGHLKLL